MPTMSGVELKDLITYGFIGAISAYKYFADKKRHSDTTDRQDVRNTLAHKQTTLLVKLQETMDMHNGCKIDDKVKLIKRIAYGDQKNYWTKECVALFHRNGLKNRELTFSNIRNIISKSIALTDEYLTELIPASYIASKKCKIEYVLSTELVERTYDLLLLSKHDASMLAPRLGDIYDYGCGLVMDKFYDDTGRIKE